MQRADYSIVDAKKKCYRVVTNLKYMGGRQMQPYHLDPLQQLPIFIEGQDQEFQDYARICFQCFPRLKEEGKSNNFPVDSITNSIDGNTSLYHKLRRKNIKLPSCKPVIDYYVTQIIMCGRFCYVLGAWFWKCVEKDGSSVNWFSKSAFSLWMNFI